MDESQVKCGDFLAFFIWLVFCHLFALCPKERITFKQTYTIFNYITNYIKNI